MIGNNAYNKKIPNEILNGSDDEILSCLEGISLDGYYDVACKKQCVYSGMSKILANQIFKLSVKLFGIESCYLGKKHVKYNNNICYYIYIDESINMIEEHKNKLVTKWNRLVIPDMKYIKSMKINYKNELYNSFNNMKRRLLNDGQQQVFSNVAKKLNIPFKNITQISNIEYIGLKNVYDIEVCSKNHLYLVNNVVTHNTINLPNKYSFEKFKELYIDAWKRGLIGVTTYRTGSMEAVLEKLDNADEKNEIIKKGVKLPETFINGITKTIKREGMKFYIHFSFLPEDKEMKYPIAMWINTNNKTNVRASTKACKKLSSLAVKCGISLTIVEDTWDKCLGDSASNRLARMVSLCLRHKIPRQDILVALRDISGDNVSTLLTAVRKFIGETIEDGTQIIGLQCPECKSDNLTMQSGCFQCDDCGYCGCGA